VRLNITQYVSEYSDALAKEMLCDDNLLITSPTDSGKTYSIIDFGEKNPQLRIAFLMPTQNLVRNIQENYKSTTSLICGMSKDFAKDNRLSRFICTTYDSFNYFDKPFDIVIIDEAHCLAGHGNFRTETLAPLLEIKSKIVLLSGTPEIIERLQAFKRIDFIRKSKPKAIKIIQSTQYAKTHAFNIIKDRNKRNLTILRINSKTIIDEIFDAYHKELNVVRLYSDSDNVQYAQQNKTTLDNVKKGIVPKEVDLILCTSILDAGISLTVERDVDCFALSDKEMPNAIDIIQLYARVRTSSKYKMDLTIVGTFGNYKIDKSIDKINAPTSRQQIKRMNTLYDEYSQFDEESYSGVLNCYGIFVNLYNQPNYKIQDAVHVGKIKPIKIVNNLHNFPTHYKRISDKLSDKGFNNCIDYFKGNTIINSTETAIVIRLAEQIETALEMNIHPSIYIDKSYNQKKVGNLISAVDSFNQFSLFKTVIAELLKGLDYKKGIKYKMDLANYNELGSNLQNQIKIVGRLLYDGRLWNRNTITLTRLEHSENVVNYLNNFLWYFQTNVA